MEYIFGRKKMKTLYGNFDYMQLEEYKVLLHKEMFWLLLYKDPQTKNNFKDINFELFFTTLMKKIDGLNAVLLYPVEIVSIMSLLQAAFIESQKDDFDYKTYRKLVLDAHSLVDKMINRLNDGGCSK